MIADGSVAELRGDSGRRHYRVEIIAPDGWLDEVLAAVPGAAAVQDGPRGDYALIDIPPDGDDQALLVAATRLGRVRQFGAAEPSLTDLFREAVADEPVTEEVTV
jgi:ABC-2 type transport system ATP-binding protein